MDISRRLKQIAGLVTEGAFVADIGTDHAFVPVYLLQQGICKKAIAMDINKGPLERAKLHIAGYGYSEMIETRLSNGMENLLVDEVDTVIIAGMGGPLMRKILTAYPEKTNSISEFILQPQSDIPEFRKFLYENEFKIIDEEMIYEDGIYYPMMKAIHGKPEEYRNIDIKYGKILIEKRHPVLRQYIEKEISQITSIISRLENVSSDTTIKRCGELREDLCLAIAALKEVTNEV